MKRGNFSNQTQTVYVDTKSRIWAALVLLLAQVSILLISGLSQASPANAGFDHLPMNAAPIHASFDETYERYPAPYDLFYHLQRLLPSLTLSELGPQCHRLGEENATVLGGILPSFGSPLENEPGALFVELYVSCLREAFLQGLSKNETIALGNLQAILGKDLLKQIMFSSALTEALAVSALDWISLDVTIRNAILARIAEYVVGPDSLLLDLELIGKHSVFGPKVVTKQDLYRVMESKSQTKTTTQLIDVIRGSTILLRLGPTVLRQ